LNFFLPYVFYIDESQKIVKINKINKLAIDTPIPIGRTLEDGDEANRNDETDLSSIALLLSLRIC